MQRIRRLLENLSSLFLLSNCNGIITGYVDIWNIHYFPALFSSIVRHLHIIDYQLYVWHGDLPLQWYISCFHSQILWMMLKRQKWPNVWQNLFDREKGSISLVQNNLIDWRSVVLDFFLYLLRDLSWIWKHPYEKKNSLN